VRFDPEYVSHVLNENFEDAKTLFLAPLMAIHYAHLVMLAKQDIVPRTDLGRAIATIMMLMGWGVLAVPTGIVTAEMTSQRLRAVTGRVCPQCGASGHTADARFCRVCGTTLGFK